MLWETRNRFGVHDACHAHPNYTTTFLVQHLEKVRKLMHLYQILYNNRRLGTNFGYSAQLLAGHCAGSALKQKEMQRNRVWSSEYQNSVWSRANMQEEKE
eukprot:16767-Amphidinium_carterae.1